MTSERARLADPAKPAGPLSRRAQAPSSVTLLGPQILLSLCALVLGACSRSTPALPAPPRDGIYRLPLTDNPETLDPALFTGVDAEGVARRIFSGLVRFDSDLRPAPDIAEEWQISPDGLTYTFRLRRGVRFHNGRELVAEDVRYSLERLLRPDTGSHRAWVATPIAGASALRQGRAEHLSGLSTPDEHTVVITLEEPCTAFLSHLAMGNAMIVPREEVEKPGTPFGRRPVGTGPFRFVRWNDNSEILLLRNEEYYGGPARLAGLRFRIIKDPLVAYREYLAGNLEHCAVPEGYLDLIMHGDHAAEMRSVPTLSTYYVGITMAREPYGSNVHLRRALNYAVDRKFLCEKVLGGSHVPARGVLPPGMPDHEPVRAGYEYNPDRAREELRLAGYGPQSPPPVRTLYVRGSAPGPQVAQAIQADLKRIGVPVEIRMLDLAALRDATDRKEPDLFYLSWIADFPEAENFLQIFHSSRGGSGGNRVWYRDPQVDLWLEEARRETDPARRRSLYRKVEEKIIADAPWVFLTHKQTQILVKPYVRGLRVTPMDVGTSLNLVDFHAVEFAHPGGDKMNGGANRIRFRCQCGREMETDASNAGKKGRCPACGAIVPIPGPSATVPTSAKSARDDGLIHFSCECGRALKTAPENRRRKFKCPQCHRVQMVPDASTRPPTSSAGNAPAISPAEEAIGFDEPSFDKPLESPVRESQEIEETEAPTAGVLGPAEEFALAEPVEAAPPAAAPQQPSQVCPHCNASRAPDAVFCVNCGFDFRKGEAAKDRVTVLPSDTSFAGFLRGFLYAFAYPLRGFREIAKGAWIAWCFMLVALIPCLGLFLLPLAFLAVLGYAGAYAVSIIHFTLEGEDEPPSLPDVSVESLLVPIWWQFVLGVTFCGPALVATVVALRIPELLGVVAALWAFAYLALPMGLLVVSGEGKLRPAQIKGTLTSLMRSPAHYLMFLAMLAIGMTVLAVALALAQVLIARVMSQTIVTRILLMSVATYIAWLMNFYLVSAYARALGIFGRYRYNALDFGEGAEGGLRPVVGGAIIGVAFLLLAGAGFAGARLMYPRMGAAFERLDTLKRVRGRVPAGSSPQGAPTERIVPESTAPAEGG